MTPCACAATGLMAHSRPDVALPIILVVVFTQSASLAVAGLVRPWLSAFLNFLEVACGGMDVATMIITAIAYRAKMISTNEQMVGIAQVMSCTVVEIMYRCLLLCPLMLCWPFAWHALVLGCCIGRG